MQLDSIFYIILRGKIWVPVFIGVLIDKIELDHIETSLTALHETTDQPRS